MSPIRYQPPAPPMWHHCDTPRPVRLVDRQDRHLGWEIPEGTIWQCDQCDRYWRLHVAALNLGAEWRTISGWRARRIIARHRRNRQETP